MSEEVVLVHSDARAITHVMQGKIKPFSSSKEMVSKVFQHLSSEFDQRPIILPTYNCDFTSTGFFDIAKDSSQVGAITEVARTKLKWKRNATPVYSFIASNFSLTDDEFPFKKESVLGSIQHGGLILLFGVGFERLTFLHVVEREASIPYRYSKRFEGKVRLESGQIEERTVEFHVRPKGLDIEYDFHKLGETLINDKGALKNSNFSYLVDAEIALAILKEKLLEYPLFPLTKESRMKVEEKLDQLGRPFEIGDFE